MRRLLAFLLALAPLAAHAQAPFTKSYATNFASNFQAQVITPFANGASWPPSEGTAGPNQYPGKVWMYDLPWGWPTNSGSEGNADCNQAGSHDAQCYSPLGSALYATGIMFNAQNVPSWRFPNLLWSSGAITSNPNYPFTYGYFQAQMWIHPGSGFNQALSIYPADLTWNFEFDPFQYIGLDANNKPTTTSFFIDNTANNGSSTSASWITNTPCTGWHNVGEDIEPTGATFYFDNKVVWSTAWTPQQQVFVTADPSFIVTFGHAVGLPGSWEGAPAAGTTNASMMVHWFQWNKSGTFTAGSPPFIALP